MYDAPHNVSHVPQVPTGFHMPVTDTATPAFSAGELLEAFAFATDWLGVHVEEVNALNVYPVPDGDTGTNMHLTLQSVRRQFSELDSVTMASFARALSYGSLLGARGNSGVILSQILKGFADSIRSHTALGSGELAAALESATSAAYAAVLKPVEGTILTVVRRVAESAANALHKRPLEVLRDAHTGGLAALKQTPDLLPLLKEAGVVDAGGLGLLRIFEGLIAHFEGRDLPAAPKIENRAQLQFEEAELGYCTEFLLAEATVDAAAIRKLVEPFGDSLLVVGAEGFIKGHIHTEEPETLLGLVARHGRMVQTKIEDMSEQHSEILASADLSAELAQTSGIVAVADGYGLVKAFRALGARVAGGGQTRNPSVEDLADAVRSVPAAEVVILPNNPNIILAAERVAAIVTDRVVRVLPTRTYGQGLAALLSFDPAASLDDSWQDMEEAAAATLTFEVTEATRTATVDGLDVRSGDSLGMVDGTIRTTADSASEALLELVREHGADGELATLFHNASVGNEAAEELLRQISEAAPELELERHSGAPEAYSFVMIVE